VVSAVRVLLRFGRHAGCNVVKANPLDSSVLCTGFGVEETVVSAVRVLLRFGRHAGCNVVKANPLDSSVLCTDI
jgi:hypothetical protein